MPSSSSPEEQIYEVMRAGKKIPFSLTVCGVKYKAVLQHKDVRDGRTTLSKINTSSPSSSSS